MDREQEEIMKRTVQRVWLVLIGAMLLYGLVPCTGLANVCSQGTGVPPFLSSGAKPNLLMVIDNSGSMLDAAYSDSASFCFDDTYDTTKTYGGYFEQGTWYKWVGPGTDASYSNLLSPWEGGHSYTAGDRVYANGIIWEARTTDTSSAVENIAEDVGISWKKITFDNVDKWSSSTSYAAGKIVWYGPQMYQAVASSTNKAPDGADGGSYWKTVDSTWENGKSYSTGDIVSYKGRLYTASVGGTSSGTGVYDDTGVTWDLLKEGSFVAVTSGEAASYCSGVSGSAKYTLTNNLCISLDVNKNPDQVSAFAARGNFLNWAMASKFDVEKKILTGGRYDPKDDLMMTEHRGCSGSRMVKQIKMDGDKFLSLSVRGSRYQDDFSYEDRVDSTDDTARLEVLAITESGYTMSDDCQAALVKIMSKDGDLNGTQNQIEKCVDSFNTSSNELTDMRPALNHSLQACWQERYDVGDAKVTSIIGTCKALYTGESFRSFKPSRAYTPSELRPKDGGPYICYGIYDPNIDAANRVGYMGRVWVDGGGGSTTVMKYCNPKHADGECSGDNCCWKAGPIAENDCLDYRNNADGYVEKCTEISGGGTETCGPQEANGECSGVDCCWGGNEEDPNQDCITYKNNPAGLVEECTKTKGKGTEKLPYTCSTWEVKEICVTDGAKCTEWKIQGRWSDNSSDCEFGVNDPVAIGTTSSAEGTWESDAGISQAIKDYCDTLKIPEVVDPSNAAGKTEETGGMPGLLRDSELMAFVGGGDPLATMKGYISEDTRPEGILQSVAGDLRLGGMAFHSVGAATECALAATDTTSKIDKYCPLDNMDGAELLVPLKDGELVTEENDSTYASGKRRHVDDLAQAINDIRATSWTPLAEAMYGALGYYTQNDEFCLNFDANGTCLDWCLETNDQGICTDPADDDPVQYWCQDNHILLITEGESTADINAEITAFAPTGSESYVHTRSSTCACHPDNMDALGVCYDDNFSGDGGTTDATCTGSLYSSTYLDDMTWWGQNIRPFYKNRCVADPDGRETEKSNIFTHVVTTGALTAGGTGECDPASLMQAAAVNGGTTDYYPGENPDDLEDNLMAVLDDILSRASAGSAASVISSSRSGSGAVYQAVFWPEYQYKDAAGKTKQVSWVGNVHSLFMNAEGAMYEDTDHDGKLDESQDKRIMFYFSDHVNKTRGCYDIDYFVKNLKCPDDTEETCDPSSGHKCVEIDDINYLWSANNYLEGLADAAVHTARKIFTWNDANNDGMVDDDEWFRLTDTVDWDALNTTAAATFTDSVTGNERGPVSRDFLTPNDWADFVSDDGVSDDDATITTISDYEYDALNALIGWLHGEDQLNDEASGTDTNLNDRRDKELRSRYYEKNGKGHTWRLGDVIHSTPIVVSRPAEAYNYIYRDPTYNDFVDKWNKRRSVVYFGANDGMLHAVNAGFYFENGNQFCCTDELNADGTCKKSPKKDTTTGISGICDGEPNLGEELWAYIPYNLQPHLKCLADKLYTHKYFVDQKPRIFDVQIFAEEPECKNGLDDPKCIHPGGWGTILVGSMRFGGSPVTAESLNSNSNDKRQFISSFFILDITNPEADLTASGAEPLLLGEMTRTTEKQSSGLDKYTNLNYTTSTPAMVIMRDGPANEVTSKWYLAMGNGPTEQSGRNTDQAQIALFPLERLKGQLDWSKTVGSGPGSAGRPTKYNSGNGKGAFRILNQEPSNDGLYEIPGRFLVPQAVGVKPTDTDRDQPGFISDIISVDYNIDMTAPDDLGARYRTDAIYFGTTDGGDFAEYQDNDAPDEQFYWNGGGRLFRLVTKVLEPDTTLGGYKEKASAPSDWADIWPATEPASTQDSAGPIRMLLDVKRPITAGPSIGYDGENYWIYAGTGRFWDEMDKTDDGWCINGDSSTGTCWDANEKTDPFKEERVQAAMFGVKEPTVDARSGTTPTDWGWASSITPTSVSCDDKVFTWQTVDWDRTSKDNEDLAPANAPGKRGLMKTDDILVASNSGILDCQHCKTNVATGDYECVTSATCFPTTGVNNFIDDLIKDGGDYTFDKLQRYTAGVGCDTIKSLYDTGVISAALYDKLDDTLADTASIATGIDGWYYEFHDPRERNLGATALLGGLLTFTSYQPFNDKCKAEGQSFLYGLHYQTGTAWTQSVFGTFNDSDGSIKQDDTGTKINPKLSLGRGLSTTPSMHVGSSDDHAAKAFIQTSTGEIIEVTQKELPYTNTKSGRMGWTDRCE
jgi:type IV pilus assembly protein PilY1